VVENPSDSAGVRPVLLDQARVSPVPTDRPVGGVSKGTMAGFLSFILGIALIVAAYHQAATGQESSRHFTVFWIGMILVWGPLALACTKDLSDRRHSALIAILGLASYLPAFVRSPTFPTFNDADGHYAEAEQIVRNSKLFVSDGFVVMASKYQGLEVLTAQLTKLSGLPLFRVGTILLALFHVLSVAGVYALANLIFNDRRAATSAALLFAISPAIAFVDSLYAYESYAIPLSIWLAVIAVRGATRPTRRSRMCHLLFAFAVGVCLDVTHHLTSYEAAAFLLLVAISSLSRRKAGVAAFAYVGALGCAVGGVAALWVVVRDVNIVPYLSYYPKQAVDAVGHTLFGTHEVAAPGAALAAQGSYRQLFGGGSLPFYENALAIVSQPILFLLAVLTAWRRRLWSSPAFIAVAVVTLVYFGSLPLDLTSAGSEGVHRSWAFTWVGLSIVCGWSLARLGGRSSSDATETPHRSIWLRTAARSAPKFDRYRRYAYSALILVVLCGAYGGDVNVDQMFPGPFVMEADGRATTEQIDVAKWFAVHEGLGRRVVSDHRNLEVFTAEAQALSTDFPAWKLFYPRTAPPHSLVDKLYGYGVQFVVVDKRLATDPSQYLWFGNGSTLPPSDPLPQQSITKFAHLPYLRAVHTTKDLIVYQVIGHP
jgi:hypothetical protein